MYPERFENQPTERRIEGFAGDGFNDALEPDETLAGIAETLARWEVRLEWKIDRAPIGQTRCVAQNVPYGDGSRPGIVCNIVRHMQRQGCVEREFAGIDQLEHRVGE
jgi:hypothetical protein